MSSDNSDGNKHRGGSPSASEDNVQNALEELEDEGEILYFLRSWRNKQLDRRGVDFVVVFEGEHYDGWSILLQVKRKASEEDGHFDKYPNIKALVVSKPDDSVRQVKNKLRKLFDIMKSKGSKARYVVKK